MRKEKEPEGKATLPLFFLSKEHTILFEAPKVLFVSFGVYQDKPLKRNVKIARKSAGCETKSQLPSSKKFSFSSEKNSLPAERFTSSEKAKLTKF